jgi:hypothetical protein
VIGASAPVDLRPSVATDSAIGTVMAAVGAAMVKAGCEPGDVDKAVEGLRGWFGHGGDCPLKARQRDIMMIGTFCRAARVSSDGKWNVSGEGAQ